MCVAITDADAGSEVASPSTLAVLKSEGYVIHGDEVMIGKGSVADFLLVYCFPEPEQRSRSHRHSIFMVETDRPGYEAEKIKKCSRFMRGQRRWKR